MIQGNKKSVVFGVLFGSALVVSIVSAYVITKRDMKTQVEYTSTTEEATTEVMLYSDEEMSADTMNLEDIDTMSEEEKNKVDDINTMKLSTYMLSKSTLQSQLKTIFSIKDEQSSKTAAYDCGGSKNLYVDCLSEYSSGFGLGEIDEVNIKEFGVLFNNQTECRYFVVVSVVDTDWNAKEFYVNLKYVSKVLTYVSITER